MLRHRAVHAALEATVGHCHAAAAREGASRALGLDGALDLDVPPPVERVLRVLLVRRHRLLAPLAAFRAVALQVLAEDATDVLGLDGALATLALPYRHRWRTETGQQAEDTAGRELPIAMKPLTHKPEVFASCL